MTPAELTKLAIAALEDMKGINIEIIDVAPLTSIADHMVICTGTSNRHVKALADSVMQKASEAGVGWPRSQGLEQGDWALVDLNGTIVHIMQASARATYQLEKLWDLGQPKPKLDAAKKAKKLAKKMAKKAAKKSAAKPAPSKKPFAKKPAAKAAPAKKAAAKKTAAKPVLKAVTKPAAKAAAKPAAKKPAAKKAAVTKAVAKKVPARKVVVAKKPAPKAPVKAIKKSAVKKPVAKAKKR
ncbi:MAG: ribosome silencing factor [Stagnimonas sp.]|nr:ribosome silencing factor [Stagnimonas sp.]